MSAITVASGNWNFCKRWASDGEIGDAAKYPGKFEFEEFPFVGVQGLHELLTALQYDPGSVVIRGTATGTTGGRDNENVYDAPRDWFALDVDSAGVPGEMSFNSDPEECIRWYASTQLPAAFQGVSFAWQLTGSAGVKPGIRAHLFFMCSHSVVGRAIDVWLHALGVKTDYCLLRPTQYCFTANPIFLDGLPDPFGGRDRVGYVEGAHGVVELPSDVVGWRPSRDTGSNGDKRGISAELQRALAAWEAANSDRLLPVGRHPCPCCGSSDGFIVNANGSWFCWGHKHRDLCDARGYDIGHDTGAGYIGTSFEFLNGLGDPEWRDALKALYPEEADKTWFKGAGKNNTVADFAAHKRKKEKEAQAQTSGGGSGGPQAARAESPPKVERHITPKPVGVLTSAMAAAELTKQIKAIKRCPTIAVYEGAACAMWHYITCSVIERSAVVAQLGLASLDRMGIKGELHGVEATAVLEAKLDACVVEAVRNDEILNDSTVEWMAKLRFDKQGLSRSEVNMRAVMTYTSAIADCFAINKRGERLMIRERPVWQRELKGVEYPRDARKEFDGAALIQFMNDECKYAHGNVKTAWEHMAALGEVNMFDPVVDYLNGLPEVDVVEAKAYVLSLSEIVFGLTADIERTILMRWLISAVKRAYEPGCQCRETLLLNGPQNKGKTRFFKALVPDILLYNGSLQGNLGGKDNAMAINRAWIVEIAECQRFMRNEEDLGTFKALISADVRSFRPPYGEVVRDFKAREVFGLTSDALGGGALVDRAGSTRMNALQTGDKIDHMYVEEHRGEIWAAIRALYKAGEQSWLTEEEKAVATQAQSNLLDTSIAEELISELLAVRFGVSAGQVCELQSGRKLSGTQLRVSTGFIPHREQIDPVDGTLRFLQLTHITAYLRTHGERCAHRALKQRLFGAGWTYGQTSRICGEVWGHRRTWIKRACDREDYVSISAKNDAHKPEITHE